jgi:hypothetical protein
MAANTWLNGSLAALIFVSVVMIPSVVFSAYKEVTFFAFPFILYSLFSYQRYRLNIQHAVDSSRTLPEKQEAVSLFDNEEALLEFMPAPSLRMLIFSPTGILCGEIRDLQYKAYRWFIPNFIDRFFSAEYGLFDGENQLAATFSWKGRKTVEIRDFETGQLFTVRQERKRNSKRWSASSKKESIIVNSAALFTDIQFMNEDRLVVSRVRKGWMPLEWARYFMNANTPVLSFDRQLLREDKLFILTVIIHLFRYYEH